MQDVSGTANPIFSIADRYGLPVALLLVLCIAIYKLIWPLLLKQIDDARAILENQLEQSNVRQDRNTQEFLQALARRDDLMRTSFDKLYERIDAPEKTIARRRRTGK